MDDCGDRGRGVDPGDSGLDDWDGKVPGQLFAGLGVGRSVLWDGHGTRGSAFGRPDDSREHSGTVQPAAGTDRFVWAEPFVDCGRACRSALRDGGSGQDGRATGGLGFDGSFCVAGGLGPLLVWAEMIQS